MTDQDDAFELQIQQLRDRLATARDTNRKLVNINLELERELAQERGEKHWSDDKEPEFPFQPRGPW